MSLKPFAFAAICAALLASPVWADDFDRRGWFVGAGGGLAEDFLSEFIEKNSMGAVEIGTTGSIHLRGGYRMLSWFALEGMYEGAFNYETTVLGQLASVSSTHSLLANMKLIVPTWRLQPYFMPGLGAQRDGIAGCAPANDLER